MSLSWIVPSLDFQRQTIDCNQIILHPRKTDEHGVGDEQPAGIARVLKHRIGHAQLAVLAVNSSTARSRQLERQRWKLREEGKQSFVDRTRHARVSARAVSVCKNLRRWIAAERI